METWKTQGIKYVYVYAKKRKKSKMTRARINSFYRMKSIKSK
jgi:hypothetical protein